MLSSLKLINIFLILLLSAYGIFGQAADGPIRVTATFRLYSSLSPSNRFTWNSNYGTAGSSDLTTLSTTFCNMMTTFWAKTDQATYTTCVIQTATQDTAGATSVTAYLTFPSNAVTNLFTIRNVIYYIGYGQYASYVLAPPATTPTIMLKPDTEITGVTVTGTTPTTPAPSSGSTTAAPAKNMGLQYGFNFVMLATGALSSSLLISQSQ